MIVVDVNLLIYAYNSAAPQHRRARTWLDAMFSGHEVIGLPWSVMHGFLRIATNPKILPNPYTMEEAVDLVDEWLGGGDIRVLASGPRYWSILKRLLAQIKGHGALVTDADIAALAIEHDATLYTADRDFRRFDGLRVINPLV